MLNLLLFFLLLFATVAGILILIAAFRNPDGISTIWATTKDKLSNSMGPRIGLVAMLIVLMTLPLALLNDLIRERGHRYAKVTQEIAELWAGEQHLQAAVLMLPYEYEIKDYRYQYNEITKKSKKIAFTKTVKDKLFILPDDLLVDTQIDPQTRKRGIYEAVVFESLVGLEASFEVDNFFGFKKPPTKLLWDQATLSFGLSETRGLGEGLSTKINGKPIPVSAGTGEAKFLGDGFHLSLENQTIEKQLKVQVSLPVRGSQAFFISPLGKQTTLKAASTWASPSFAGALLPETREISADGFSAKWKVSHLARSYPQAWRASSKVDQQMQSFRIGVRLAEPVWLYSKTERAVKYALLVIGLTFFLVLLLEHLLKVRFHIVQYGVIAFALCLVYLLILSLSEHIGFARAYGAAAGLIIFLTAAYAQLSLGVKQLTGWLAVSLASLFGALYTILNLEDYALLAGTGLLVLALIALMFATKGLSKPEVS